jgi:small subunit ribosomal protein S9
LKIKKKEMIKKETTTKKPAHAKAPVHHATTKPAAHHAPAHSPRLNVSGAGKVAAAHHAPKIAPGRYFEGIGRRKTAVARVRVMKGDGKFVINGKDFDKYFQAIRLSQIAEEALKRLGVGGALDISVKIEGGGINAQAEAVRHGISRALALMNPDLKIQLAALGLLTRDSRMVERKKYGLKKARRAPQWKKR